MTQPAPNLRWTLSHALMWEAYRAEASADLDDEQLLRRREYRQGSGRRERFEAVAVSGLPLSSYGIGMAYAGANPADVEHWLPVAQADTTSWLRRLFHEGQASGATVTELVRALAMYGHLGEARKALELRKVQRQTAYGPGWVDSADEFVN